MRISGIIKIAAVLGLDFTVIYCLFGWEAAAVVTAGILLYAWLGEYLALWKDGAIRADRLQDYERSRLTRAMEHLAMDVQRTSGRSISRLKIHLIPSDSINAYAYGLRNIAVTRAALQCCDDATLCAVLGHELSHIFNLDAVFFRLLFASVALILGGLIGISFLSVSFLWIIFAVLCALRLCGGIFSMFLFRGFSSLIKGFFTLIQHGVLFLYQTVMGFINRGCEYRADRYSCQLGYGPQLSYFLTRFIEGGESRTRSLTEIIYSTHPATYKRTLRIEQYSSAP